MAVPTAGLDDARVALAVAVERLERAEREREREQQRRPAPPRRPA